MKIKECIQLLEQWANPLLAESYDNCGLIVGNSNTEITSALITLDCTEAVVEEAISKNCNLIIAHHPIVFSGLRKIVGKNYVERTVLKAIKNDIAIYAIHTNLDNVQTGVNHMIAEKIGLKNTRILQPKSELYRKLVTYIPLDFKDKVAEAVFNAGAGNIGNYSEASFFHIGTGTFKGNDASNPAIGKPNELEALEEYCWEVIFPFYLQSKVVAALKSAHPYEEVAYNILLLKNETNDIGSGMIGELEEEIDLHTFLEKLKEVFGCQSIKYTPIHKKVKRVALCGGSGSFLRMDAMALGADAFITADMKYHEFFDSEGQMSIMDIGHYESEQFTKELIFNYIKKNVLSLPTQISSVNTNPVKYYI